MSFKKKDESESRQNEIFAALERHNQWLETLPESWFENLPRASKQLTELIRRLRSEPGNWTARLRIIEKNRVVDSPNPEGAPSQILYAATTGVLVRDRNELPRLKISIPDKDDGTVCMQPEVELMIFVQGPDERAISDIQWTTYNKENARGFVPGSFLWFRSVYMSTYVVEPRSFDDNDDDVERGPVYSNVFVANLPERDDLVVYAELIAP